MPSTDTRNLNDKGILEDGTFIDPQNRAFRYGDGLFETILVRNGQPWRIKSHLDRMLVGMEVLGFSFQSATWRKKMNSAVAQLVGQCRSEEFARIRIQVYRGGGGAYLPEHDQPEYSASMETLEEDPWQSTAPLKVGVYHSVPLSHSILSTVKSLNALPYILGARFAQSQGWDDALLRSTNGELAESTRANLFIVRSATLYTPVLTSGCLPGVMRATVLDAARAIGLETVEIATPLHSLGSADEIFLTNVIRGLMPVGQIAESDWQPESDTVRSALLHQIQFQS